MVSRGARIRKSKVRPCIEPTRPSPSLFQSQSAYCPRLPERPEIARLPCKRRMQSWRLGDGSCPRSYPGGMGGGEREGMDQSCPSGGVDQFSQSRRLTGGSDNGEWGIVEGSGM